MKKIQVHASYNNLKILNQLSPSKLDPILNRLHAYTYLFV